MKGFIEVTNSDNKTKELIRVDSIVGVMGSGIMTIAITDDGYTRRSYVAKTCHTYEELKQKIEEALI